MKTWRLQTSLWVPQQPAAVFPFFADAQNLQRLTPDWVSFRILTPLPVEMRADARLDYRIRIHGLPVHWQTRITRWEPPHTFADEQLRGPYSLWHHTHTFTEQRGGTLLGDDVRMRPKGGPLAGAVMAMFVRRDVERIFRFRAQAMALRFGGDASRAELRWIDADTDADRVVSDAAAGGAR